MCLSFFAGIFSLFSFHYDTWVSCVVPYVTAVSILLFTVVYTNGHEAGLWLLVFTSFRLSRVLNVLVPDYVVLVTFDLQWNNSCICTLLGT